MSTRWYSSECWMPSWPLPVMVLSRITTPTSAMKDQGLGILDHAGRLSCYVPHGQCGSGKV